MTEAEYDTAIGELAARTMKRLDMASLELGFPPRRHRPHLGVLIRLSELLSEDDLVNALHDSMQALKLDFCKMEEG